MKSPLLLLLLLAVLSFACARQQALTDSRLAQPASTATTDNEKTVLADPAVAGQSGKVTFSLAGQQGVSLSQADQSQLINEAVDRKIIRNAELSIEVDAPSQAQHRITSIAESLGGFVVTSEAKQRENIDPSKRTLDIKLVVRIPSERFGATLDEIKKLASNLPAENVTGQDVTEDFIDLEARIKTQKALELQFIEIMKQARKVEDALEVQRQIADVRTEIERLEGRKRFLENRSSLSTITVNIQAPKVIAVNPTGYGHSIRDAVSESLELASGMLVFFVRFVIMLVPVFVFVLLPSGLILRYFVRRAKRMRLAEALATPSPE
jgi:Domain of unknown function (DUF4349)